VSAPGEEALFGSDGRAVPAPAIRAAIRDGRTELWLSREEAAALGLSPRRAVAGIARIEDGPRGPWATVVVSSAERLRDRERRAHFRLVLGVGLAATLVLLFGSAALRRQRRELDLQRELAITDLQRDRDRQLAAASRSATMGTLA